MILLESILKICNPEANNVLTLGIAGTGAALAIGTVIYIDYIRDKIADKKKLNKEVIKIVI